MKNKVFSYAKPEKDKMPLMVQEEAIALPFSQERKLFKYLGINQQDFSGANIDYAFLTIIRGGLSRHSLDTLMEETGINVYEMAQILDTTDRTLRRYDADVKLNREQSERVLELARLYSRGEDIFGDVSVFKQWMNADVPAMGNQAPKSFLDTSLGIDMLMNELGRIEYGVFA